MNLAGSKFLSVGLFFVFIFLSGFWLSRLGKPYSMVPITVHKLVGLALGVYLGMTVHKIHKTDTLSPVQFAVVGITILFFIVNVTTGSLLSADKPMPEAISIMNKFFPYLTVASTAVTLYLLS